MAFNCNSSTSQFFGDASVNNPEAFLLECLSSGTFDLDFTADEVLTLCEAELCPPVSPSTSYLTESLWSAPSTPGSSSSLECTSVPSSPSTACSTSQHTAQPGSSCPSSPSAVCPASPFSCSTSPLFQTHGNSQFNICCSMFVPCSSHGCLTQEEEQIILQKKRYRQEKLEKYRMKRHTRNFNKRVNENRSRVAQKRVRDEHGHFVSTKKASQVQNSQMQARRKEPKPQMVPDFFAPAQWDPSPFGSSLPIFS